jgi:hypothetical protein
MIFFMTTAVRTSNPTKVSILHTTSDGIWLHNREGEGMQ